uniref:Uncharacterized protein n=1 Tax=Panagrolaimus sp. ES5 TaxID=591445 RepID=A0AC34GQ67_9BILA
MIIANYVLCDDKSVAAKVNVIKSTGTPNVKIDSPTTLKKEETTIAVNETLTLATKKNEVEDIKAPEKEIENKKENPPEKVQPKKPAKILPTIPSAVNPPKAKADKPAKVQVPNTHHGRTILILLGFLFVCYCIFQNKKRIMGLLVEGPNSRPSGRRGGASVRYRRLNTDDAVVEAGIQ